MHLYPNINNDFCPFSCFTYCPSKKSNMRFPQSGSSLTMTTNEMLNSNDKIHEDLRIPIFHGNINPSLLEYINNNIKNDILEFKEQMEVAAEENDEEEKKKGHKPMPFEISNTYLVTYNKNSLLSVSLIYEQVINKHNSYIRTTYNYDLQTGRSMSLKDLFIPGINYLEILNKKIKEKLQINKNLYFPNSLTNFRGIAEDQPFYLDENNLIIFFKFSEIAPITSDIPVIRLPYSELKNILKPGLF